MTKAIAARQNLYKPIGNLNWTCLKYLNIEIRKKIARSIKITVASPRRKDPKLKLEVQSKKLQRKRNTKGGAQWCSICQTSRTIKLIDQPVFLSNMKNNEWKPQVEGIVFHVVDKS